MILAPPPRRWVPRGTAPAAVVSALQQSLNLPAPLCRLLAVRGLGEEAAARHFLRPRLDQVLDPFALAGMEAAVERIGEALERGETILVHGDYDVDGICATALYTRVLRALGGRVEPFVPNRLADGYDLGPAGVETARRVGATLILTGDCGIVAHEAIARAAEDGIDVVVTDHHTPGATLPEAVAVVNPQRHDCLYPDKALAGTGVAFKLCQALYAARGGDPEELWYYLDLVALATIADLVPLMGENRVFCRYGLRVLEESRNPGLRALLESAGVRGPVSAGQVGHQLAPRLNAIGRMDEASWGVRLLLTEDEAEAAAIARRLDEQNRVRQAVDRRTLDEALELLARDYDPEQDYGLVLAAPGWHPGVIGIVASRVVERVHRPAILIALDEATGRARGSGRSIRGFHLYDALDACAGHLDRFGGHRQAAGLEIQSDRIDAFREAFNARARALLGPDDLAAEVDIDLEVALGEADQELYDLLRHFGPFGMRNPAPVFAARGVRVAGAPRVVGDGHLKLELSQGDTRLGAIGFRMADRLPELDLPHNRLDVAFQLQENTWNGRTELQARLVDLRVAEGVTEPAAARLAERAVG
jgi:single-stranded-DNA-specific exonuclease